MSKIKSINREKIIDMCVVLISTIIGQYKMTIHVLKILVERETNI